MIIDSIITGLKNLILWFIDLLPTVSVDFTDMVSSSVIPIFSDIKEILNYFLTAPVAWLLIGSFVGWLVVFPTISLIKFIYKKIPGVD